MDPLFDQILMIALKELLPGCYSDPEELAQRSVTIALTVMRERERVQKINEQIVQQEMEARPEDLEI